MACASAARYGAVSMITRGSPSLTMLPSLYMRFCSTPGTRARTSDARVGASRPEASRTSGTGAGMHDDDADFRRWWLLLGLLLAAGGDKQSGHSRANQLYA